MPGKGKGEFNMGFYKVHSATILGLKVEFVQVEADAGNGLPMFHMVGYLSSEVKEAAERYFILAGAERFELPSTVLETAILPLNYAPM